MSILGMPPMADPMYAPVQGSGAPPGYTWPNTGDSSNPAYAGLVNNAGQPVPGNPGYIQGSGAPPGGEGLQTFPGGPGLAGMGMALAGGALGQAGGAPPGAPAGGGSTPYYQDPYAQSLYQQAQAYNADPYGNGGFGPSFAYDPTGGMGYGGASPGSGWGSYGGYGMGGANSGYGGGGGYLAPGGAGAGIIASGQSALGQIGAAQASAVPGTIAANNAPGIQAGMNAANQAIAQTQAAPALLSAQNQLPLQEEINKVGLANIANQIPLANIGNQVGLANVGLGQNKLDLQRQMFDKLLGTGILGGGAGGGGAGGTGTGGGAPGGPPLPQSQVINPLLLQQAINQSQNQIAGRYGSLRNQLAQQLANRGMSTAGGLPPGMEQQLTMGESPELTDAARQWNLGAAGQNAGQSNTVSQMGLSQYNAAADRALRMQLAAMGLLGNFAA